MKIKKCTACTVDQITCGGHRLSAGKEKLRILYMIVYGGKEE